MTSALARALPHVLAAATTEALKQANANPNVAANVTPAAQAAIASAIVDKVAASPEIQHAASTEAWYQSRANWSAIVAAVTPLVSILGYTLAPEDQLMVAGALALVGNGIAAFLARRARTATKPLGA